MKKLYNIIFSFSFFKKMKSLPVLSKVLEYEFLIYIVFGFLTTAVNFVVSAVCNKIFGFGNITTFVLFGKTVNLGWELVTNSVAWVLAVLFAFITNKIWVFESKNRKPAVVLKEGISFFSSRFFAFLMFDILVFSLVQGIALKMGAGENASFWTGKIAASILNIIFNYIVSKFIIFKGKKK